MIICVLRCFEAVLGLRINFAKCTIYKVREVLNLGVLAGSLGCAVGHFPAAYLGLPLGKDSKERNFGGRENKKKAGQLEDLYLLKGER